MADSNTPDLARRKPVFGEQKAIASNVKTGEDPITGTTVNAMTTIYSAADRRVERNAGIYILIRNTGATNDLNFQVQGRLTGTAASSNITLVGSTIVQESDNSGIITLHPAIRTFIVQVQSAVAGSATTYELQTCYAPVT